MQKWGNNQKEVYFLSRHGMLCMVCLYQVWYHISHIWTSFPPDTNLFFTVWNIIYSHIIFIITLSKIYSLYFVQRSTFVQCTNSHKVLWTFCDLFFQWICCLDTVKYSVCVNHCEQLTCNKTFVNLAAIWCEDIFTLIHWLLAPF